jgi:hypothetical protein
MKTWNLNEAKGEGDAMKRVTQVLGEAFPWDNRWGTDDDRKFWMERGTAVHAACEYHDKGTLDAGTVDVEHVMPRLEAWMKFRRDVGGEIVAIELPVESKKLHYCGRLDRILRGCSMYPTCDLLLDIKSGKPQKVCALQTMAYKMALPTQRRKVRRCSVELRVDGKYDVTHFVEDDQDTVGWMGCLWVYEWKERNGMLLRNSGSTKGQ